MNPIKILSVFLLCCITSACYAGYTDTALIKYHLTTLTKTPKFRTEKNLDQLNKTADYIKNVFTQYSDSVSVQEYTVNG